MQRSSSLALRRYRREGGDELVEAWRVAFVRDVNGSDEELKAARTLLYQLAEGIARRALRSPWAKGGSRVWNREDYKGFCDEVLNRWFVRRMMNPLTKDSLQSSDAGVQRHRCVVA